jgi:fructose-1,6-bisphosphatase/inositol monophosphatase family enzyme
MKDLRYDKSIENLFNEIIVEDFPNHGIKVEESLKISNRHNQKITSPYHIIG